MQRHDASFSLVKKSMRQWQTLDNVTTVTLGTSRIKRLQETVEQCERKEERRLKRYSRHGHGQREGQDDDLLFLLLGMQRQQERQELLQLLQHDLLLDFTIGRDHVFRDQDEVQQQDGQEEKGRLLTLVQSHVRVISLSLSRARSSASQQSGS